MKAHGRDQTQWMKNVEYNAFMSKIFLLPLETKVSRQNASAADLAMH